MDLQLQLVGFTAGILVVICSIPQLVKIIENKSVENVSIEMYYILLVAQILWIYYAILKNDTVLLATNLSSICITILIIISSFYYT